MKYPIIQLIKLHFQVRIKSGSAQLRAAWRRATLKLPHISQPPSSAPKDLSSPQSQPLTPSDPQADTVDATEPRSGHVQVIVTANQTLNVQPSNPAAAVGRKEGAGVSPATPAPKRSHKRRRP